MGKKITQLATITEVADDDLIVGVDVSDTSGSENGTNKKFTKASLLDGLAPLDPQITGWNPLGEDLVYVSVDDPTGVVKVEGKDITDKLSVGMRLRFTNGGNVINAIITAITFSVDTTITFLHEIDPADSQALYLLANSAITLPYFSSQKAPYGFPLSPAKWSVETTDTTSRGQSNPSGNTYYSPGDLSIVVPIGVWKLQYQIVAQMQSTNATTVLSGLVALSTSTTSPSDPGLRCGIVMRGANGAMQHVAQVGKEKVLSLTSKATYYPIFASETTLVGNITFRNDIGTLYLTATCAYL